MPKDSGPWASVSHMDSLQPLVEKVSRQAEPDPNYEPSHEVAIHPSGGVRSEISPDNRGTRHDQRVLPCHLLINYKDRHGDTVNARREAVFDGVHVIDITDTHHRERTEHEDADPRTEVAAVDGDNELKDYQSD